jgi:hypothetical protein
MRFTNCSKRQTTQSKIPRLLSSKISDDRVVCPGTHSRGACCAVVTLLLQHLTRHDQDIASRCASTRSRVLVRPRRVFLTALAQHTFSYGSAQNRPMFTLFALFTLDGILNIGRVVPYFHIWSRGHPLLWAPLERNKCSPFLGEQGKQGEHRPVLLRFAEKCALCSRLYEKKEDNSVYCDIRFHR